jgi:ribosomal-protein-alanine N-acetyltransferase
MSDNIVRLAVFSDHRALSAMLEKAPVHRHMEWRDPLSWIGSQPFLVLERKGVLVGALACPPDPPGVAWLRLFVFDGAGDEKNIWQSLWEAASSELSRENDVTAAAIVMAKWMLPLLEGSGFSTRQQLVMLEKNDGEISAPAVHGPGISVRPMLTRDLEIVSEVDAAAFAPLWQNSRSDLSRAHSMAYLAAVAELGGRVVGYHISTRNSIGIHLARLAVLPELQGRGIGHALLNDLLLQAERRNIHRFTVNTQSDNAASLTIYRKLGFIEQVERYPVYRQQLSN